LVMRVWALIETGDTEAIDVFLAAGDAERALAECVRDEPEWRGLLHVHQIQLDEEAAPVRLPTDFADTLRAFDRRTMLSGAL
jgi:hypothetical protein